MGSNPSHGGSFFTTPSRILDPANSNGLLTSSAGEGRGVVVSTFPYLCAVRIKGFNRTYTDPTTVLKMVTLTEKVHERPNKRD